MPRHKVTGRFTASLRGFEPPTYRLGGDRSILLSYNDLSEDTIIFYNVIVDLSSSAVPGCLWENVFNEAV